MASAMFLPVCWPISSQKSIRHSSVKEWDDAKKVNLAFPHSQSNEPQLHNRCLMSTHPMNLQNQRYSPTWKVSWVYSSRYHKTCTVNIVFKDSIILSLRASTVFLTAQQFGILRRESSRVMAGGRVQWTGTREVVGGVVGETREGLHKDRTGRQLDSLSEYYRLWSSYFYYYWKNYGSI